MPATSPLGMVGLGRMGSGLVRRLLRRGHACAVFDPQPAAVAALQAEGAAGAASLPELVAQLETPRTVWLMVPAATVDSVIGALAPLLATGDLIVDGGNSHYRDTMRRGAELRTRGIHYLDVGTSGGTAGEQRGYCLMVGGPAEDFARLQPVFAALAPGVRAAPRTPGLDPGRGTAEQGFLHCGAQGAGHFVKMVHNGIEYGLMAAYAEGLNVLRRADAGLHPPAPDAETAPLRDPEAYHFEMNLPEIAELWRRGSVIGSWLLDLTAAALTADATLARSATRVADSGEGRWLLQAALDEGVPTHVLAAALFERFSSRGEADYASRVLSAMRFGFGGHTGPAA